MTDKDTPLNWKPRMRIEDRQFTALKGFHGVNASTANNAMVPPYMSQVGELTVEKIKKSMAILEENQCRDRVELKEIEARKALEDAAVRYLLLNNGEIAVRLGSIMGKILNGKFLSGGVVGAGAFGEEYIGSDRTEYVMNTIATKEQAAALAKIMDASKDQPSSKNPEITFYVNIDPEGRMSVRKDREVQS